MTGVAMTPTTKSTIARVARVARFERDSEGGRMLRLVVRANEDGEGDAAGVHRDVRAM